MSLAKVSVNPYKHSPTSKWDVDYPKNGKRTREFFRTKKEANTRRDQILIELENLGNKAFAISDDLRLEAVQCAERLAPFKHSLSDAVDFFMRHLEASRNSCSIGELIGDYLNTKSRKQNSERYLSDLNNRHWRFASKIYLKCLTGCFAIGIGDHHTELPRAFGIAAVVENEFVLSLFTAHSNQLS